MNALILAAKMSTQNIILLSVFGVLLIGMLVLPFIRNRRQSKDFQAMVENLSAGDRIMTNTGIYGTIKKIMKKPEGTTFLLETGEKTVIEFDVGAIARVLYSVKPAPMATKQKKENTVTEEVKEETVEEPKADKKPAEPKQAKVKQTKK